MIYFIFMITGITGQGEYTREIKLTLFSSSPHSTRCRTLAFLLYTG